MNDAPKIQLSEETLGEIAKIPPFNIDVSKIWAEKLPQKLQPKEDMSVFYAKNKAQVVNALKNIFKELIQSSGRLSINLSSSQPDQKELFQSAKEALSAELQSSVVLFDDPKQEGIALRKIDEDMLGVANFTQIFREIFQKLLAKRSMKDDKLNDALEVEFKECTIGNNQDKKGLSNILEILHYWRNMGISLEEIDKLDPAIQNQMMEFRKKIMSIVDEVFTELDKNNGLADLKKELQRLDEDKFFTDDETRVKALMLGPLSDVVKSLFYYYNNSAKISRYSVREFILKYLNIIQEN
jgi:cytochrome c556